MTVQNYEMVRELAFMRAMLCSQLVHVCVGFIKWTS